MPASRPLLWRLLPWLLPIGLILLGSIFITASLTGNDQPEGIVAPPNVRDVTTSNAAAWALRQVDRGTSEVTGVIMVSSRAIDATHYAIRAVVGRVDVPDETLVRTVVTCVRWDVDVSTGTIAEHGADQLSNRTGRHALGDTADLRRQCTAATFAG